jgi:hypothetical protein
MDNMDTYNTDVGSSFCHPVAGKVELVLYLRFKKASEVCNFHIEIPDLIFPYKNVLHQPLQKC